MSTTDLFDLPARKTYRRHECHQMHGTHRQFAACIWPTAAFISGSGQWAVISRCRTRRPTITLHDDIYRARAALTVLDRTNCGGVCRGSHEIIRLSLR